MGLPFKPLATCFLHISLMEGGVSSGHYINQEVVQIESSDL